MLRSPGVFTAPFTETAAPAGTAVPLTSPCEAIWATESEGNPEGSGAPTPRSSVVGRTPMLWKPTSCHDPLASCSTKPPRAATLDQEASVSSAPLWHLLQPPLPV